MKARSWMYLGTSFLISLSSCVSNNVLADAHAADNNVNRLSRISLRMNQEEVLAIMHAPCEKEAYRVGDDRYDIWFYVTTMSVLGQSRMVPKNLTPLTFRNKQLVGVGYDYYHWVQKREPKRMQPARAHEEPEDKELEEQLQKAVTPNQTTLPQKKQSNGPTTPSPQVQPAKPQPLTPQSTPTPPQQPSNNPSPDLKLGPPPYVPPSKPKTQGPAAVSPDLHHSSPKQSTMSRAPERALEEKKPKTSSDPSDSLSEPKKKPEWDEKDEEMNEDAQDQDFNFW